ncbi:unnamed protein product [Vitrella brassicaformis CCMP3155]|uniref:J domain-containing protein n=1 Tax=Vitrella brassicaformis (strain CCMP3155) TaxID=1169540 RepID=A0A0G4H844_VITBC|nr:unnamed protein product [Vitrella brassicaformis CCMP3155]|eukprot:CEM40061.1 unnamed protein product [Vitrella brassicaformis CCMP3155]
MRARKGEGRRQLHHPDKGGETAAFQQLGRAYEVLSDEQARARYDAIAMAHHGRSWEAARLWEQTPEAREAFKRAEEKLSEEAIKKTDAVLAKWVFFNRGDQRTLLPMVGCLSGMRPILRGDRTTTTNSSTISSSSPRRRHHLQLMSRVVPFHHLMEATGAASLITTEAAICEEGAAGIARTSSGIRNGRSCRGRCMAASLRAINRLTTLPKTTLKRPRMDDIQARSSSSTSSRPSTMSTPLPPSPDIHSSTP